jgi:hypothetical protein
VSLWGTYSLIPHFRTNLNNLLGLVSRYSDELTASPVGSISTLTKKETSNPNWRKFEEIYEEVLSIHEDLERMLDEMEYEPGHTEKEKADNLKLLEVSRLLKTNPFHSISDRPTRQAHSGTQNDLQCSTQLYH